MTEDEVVNIIHKRYWEFYERVLDAQEEEVDE